MNSDQVQPAYPLPELPQIPERVFRITDYGAEGDGLTLCTPAIQAALDDCAAAGGGKVVIPPGIWRSGPLTLHSRINLCAELGALVRFEADTSLYPLLYSHYEGNAGWRCQSPLDGDGLSDIAITGEGIFDGSGEGWRPVKRFKMTELQWQSLVASGGVLDEQEDMWWPSREAMEGEARYKKLLEQGTADKSAYLPVRDYLRPVLLSLRNCKRVLLEGPTFQNSPAWCLHPIGCEQVTVRRIQVRNPWYSQNGDGLDLESCSHALVEHCSFDVGDDAICLKSGKDEEGRRAGRPCRYITIRHCTVYHGHGGVVIGSEMSGGVHAVRVSDCLFIGTDIGLRFKSARGRGGVVEDILMENIRMTDIIHEAVSFHMFYAGVEGSEGYNEQQFPVTEETPQFRNITLKNIVCHGAATGLLVNGLPELPLAGLSVENFHAVSEQGMVLRYADGLKLDGIRLDAQQLPLLKLHKCSNVELTRSSGLVLTEA
ncbi:glycoside hydrolase family 28 protein [Paenibacillus sp. MMS20-IR301]|uniref:glycoside hydrolase family 28 protein n=1 Tax=Paenibacillus sp. MMS20-IR301 TaxID=2895946 RepID=UPI0028E57250|nr:glycoside hydrolase family 28 protein [Paenibacillus sp. MMS20-IR301]WNS46504.1 glycoside hydrolase family 28 protein [Paenibacillus sp. MMS20-IR301]